MNNDVQKTIISDTFTNRSKITSKCDPTTIATN